MPRPSPRTCSTVAIVLLACVLHPPTAAAGRRCGCSINDCSHVERIVDRDRDVFVFNNVTTSPIAAQGATAYTFDDVRADYAVDLDGHLGRLLAIVEGDQRGFRELVLSTAGLLAVQGSNQADVARILAQGEAAERILAPVVDALRPQTPNAWGVIVTPDGDPRRLTDDELAALGRRDYFPGNDEPTADTFAAVLSSRCAACHGGRDPAEPAGGLDLTDPRTIGPDQVERLLARIVHTDPAKQMPQAPDGGPGEPLSINERAPFYRQLNTLRMR